MIEIIVSSAPPPVASGRRARHRTVENRCVAVQSVKASHLSGPLRSGVLWFLRQSCKWSPGYVSGWVFIPKKL